MVSSGKFFVKWTANYFIRRKYILCMSNLVWFVIRRRLSLVYQWSLRFGFGLLYYGALRTWWNKIQGKVSIQNQFPNSRIFPGCLDILYRITHDSSIKRGSKLYLFQPRVLDKPIWKIYWKHWKTKTEDLFQHIF